MPFQTKSSFELIRVLWKGNKISRVSLILAPRHQSLQLPVIPPLDTSLRPPGKHLLQPSPMFPMLHHKPTDLQIFLKRESLFGDFGTEVIQVPFSYLFGSEFCVRGKVLGILELICFHFSPSLRTMARTASSYAGDQARSLLAMEMRRQREQHMFWVLPEKCEGSYFHSNFQTSINLDSSRSYQAVQWVFRWQWAEECSCCNLDSIISQGRTGEGFQFDGEVDCFCGSRLSPWKVFSMGQGRKGVQCMVTSATQGRRTSWWGKLGKLINQYIALDKLTIMRKMK